MEMRFMVWGALFFGAMFVGAREVPVPQSDKPGNVSLEGDRVAIRLTAAFGGASRWEARDLEGGLAAQGMCAKGAVQVDAGLLPVGWYRVRP